MVLHFYRNILKYSLLILFATLMLNSCGAKRGEYSIKDYFVDDSEQGRVVFFFIETKERDTEELNKIARKIFSTHEIYAEVKPDAMKVIMAHFYDPEKIGFVPENMRQKIIDDYNGNVEFLDKIRFVRDGFIYAGFSREIKDLNIRQNNAFPSEFIVPADGFKAAEIIESRKK